MRNLAVSKPGNHNLWSKTAIEKKLQIIINNKRSFFADSKLQVDQRKTKIQT